MVSLCHYGQHLSFYPESILATANSVPSEIRDEKQEYVVCCFRQHIWGGLIRTAAWERGALLRHNCYVSSHYCPIARTSEMIARAGARIFVAISREIAGMAVIFLGSIFPMRPSLTSSALVNQFDGMPPRPNSSPYVQALFPPRPSGTHSPKPNPGS